MQIEDDPKERLLPRQAFVGVAVQALPCSAFFAPAAAFVLVKGNSLGRVFKVGGIGGVRLPDIFQVFQGFGHVGRHHDGNRFAAALHDNRLVAGLHAPQGAFEISLKFHDAHCCHEKSVARTAGAVKMPKTRVHGGTVEDHTPGWLTPTSSCMRIPSRLTRMSAHGNGRVDCCRWLSSPGTVSANRPQALWQRGPGWREGRRSECSSSSATSPRRG